MFRIMGFYFELKGDSLMHTEIKACRAVQALILTGWFLARFLWEFGDVRLQLNFEKVSSENFFLLFCLDTSDFLRERKNSFALARELQKNFSKIFLESKA